MYRPPLRNFAVTLLGVGAVFVLYDLHIRAMWGSFEVDKPTPFARLELMWSLLLCIIPGVAVGFFVTRRSLWLSAFAYAIGALIGFYYHGGNGSIEAGKVLPERPLTVCIPRAGDFCRYRGVDGASRWVVAPSSNNRFERSRAASSVSQGGNR